MAAKEKIHLVPPIITPLLVIPLPKSSSADLNEPIPFLLVQFHSGLRTGPDPQVWHAPPVQGAWMKFRVLGASTGKSPTLQNGKSIGSHSLEKRSLICCLNNNAWFIFSFSVLLFLICSKSIGSCQLRNFLEENGCKRKNSSSSPHHNPTFSHSTS